MPGSHSYAGRDTTQHIHLTEAEPAPLDRIRWAEAIMDLSGWVVDMALYLERTGMEENMQANWMLKNAITRYHSSLEKLQMECRMLAAT